MKLVTKSDLQELVGKIVVFNDKCDILEDYCETGMRARVIGFSFDPKTDPNDICHKVHVDYSEFDDFNRRFEQSNYYDQDQNPTLNARQAGFYKSQDTLYLAPDVDRMPITVDEALTVDADRSRSEKNDLHDAAIDACMAIAAKAGRQDLASRMEALKVPVPSEEPEVSGPSP